MDEGGYLNEGIKTVSVDLFENRSSLTQAGVTFSNELIEEILKRTDTRVVSADQATRRISGTVTAITFSTLSRISTEMVDERLITVKLDVQLRSPGNEILWSMKDFFCSDDYIVSGDSDIEDELNINKTVEKIAARAAERIVRQMMENF